jgi:replicative DNA helicase
VTGVAERTLPHNLEAERSILGAVLMTYGQSLDAIADRLEAADFYRDAHQRLFRSMVALYTRNEPVDFVTLQERLRRVGDLDEVGGPAYIANLTSGVPTSTNVVHYARIVREQAIARNVIVAANRILTKAYDHDGTSAELIDLAERALLDLSGQATPGDLVAAKDLVLAVTPVLDAITSARRPLTGQATGFEDLDRYTRGLQPGNLVIVAGRPGQGKSTLGTQIALHASKTAPVAFFSLEMAQIEQTFRVVSTLGHVDGHRLQCGQLGMFELQSVAGALADFSDRQFWLDDTATITALQIRSKARRLKAKHGLGLIVVDYLQLLQHPKGDNNEQRVASTGRILREIARELEVPVLALCQLNRAVEQRENQRPRLSDLRESGSLEQDAHVVLLIHRQAKKPTDAETPPTELIIAKQRNGPTASVDLHWLPEQYRFADLETHR